MEIYPLFIVIYNYYLLSSKCSWSHAKRWAYQK